MRNLIRVGFAALVLSLVLLSSLRGLVVAGPLDDAINADRRGDYATEFRLLGPLAEQGDPLAQYGLGLLYSRGLGTVQNVAEAVRWYRKSAEQGFAEAQGQLGRIYLLGAGVSPDLNAGAVWLRRAAEQGITFAQCILGMAYEYGLGVPQDFVQALKWYNLGITNETDSNQRKVWSKSRENLISRMTTNQITEAQKLAHKWKPKPEAIK